VPRIFLRHKKFSFRRSAPGLLRFFLKSMNLRFVQVFFFQPPSYYTPTRLCIGEDIKGPPSFATVINPQRCASPVVNFSNLSKPNLPSDPALRHEDPPPPCVRAFFQVFLILSEGETERLEIVWEAHTNPWLVLFCFGSRRRRVFSGEANARPHCSLHDTPRTLMDPPPPVYRWASFSDVLTRTCPRGVHFP